VWQHVDFVHDGGVVRQEDNVLQLMEGPRFQPEPQLELQSQVRIVSLSGRDLRRIVISEHHGWREQVAATAVRDP
jgi:hypothetical protein